MNIYAVLNKNKICTGISQLSGEVLQDDMIEIPEFSNEYMWKKHIDGVWSEEKFEPSSTAPLDAFSNMQTQIENINLALADMMGV